MNHHLLSCLLFLFLPFLLPAQSPVELGDVRWGRDFDAALRQAEAKGKPVFLLFQEVPGCATCRNYGQDVLTHPLIVEAIEELFVPVAIYNNKDGKDAAVLNRYREPAWNNPVVRIVDNAGKDLAPRVSGDYSALGVVRAMGYALQRSGKGIPVWLDLLRQELEGQTHHTEEATLAMYCFWTGEKELGQLDGVLATEAGWAKGREVVRVQYDPEVITYDELISAGQAVRCADRAWPDVPADYRTDREPKYYLSKTVYRYVPMTPLQAARANALVGEGRNPESVLSPRQIAMKEFMEAHPELKWESRIGKNWITGWEEVWGRME